MKNVYADAIKTPINFVTGLTPTTFEEVYHQFALVAIQRLSSTETRVHTRIIDRNLLFLLVHWLRCYPTYPQLSLLFGVRPKQISRHIRRFLPDLAESLKAEIRWPSLTKFDQQLSRHPAIGRFVESIDGTRQRIQRPGKRQRIYYSGKTKYHCLASIYVISNDRKLILFESGFFGSYHDSRIFNSLQVGLNNSIPPNMFILGDRGFANKPPIIIPFRKNGLPHAGITEFQRFLYNKTCYT
ncbi:unnamed protein product [Didymodactylos carnosus]|uniref:DDE Tnp4 domain-containing protein n=1 Tax=Didymodactylos carnosus TaxID=1234261 RepID=A0A815Y4X6_9BILA|nr:unnamed protein product [Didymodactylos carnosus]CAF1566783.1 unnamed protein product [Didymodactylos carnosus]CAF4136873.1 unnamed protein product [Didymodactylos carnosus]CAF4429140.1 unnamed protein product [Didymodactylos carnosus]